MMKWALIVSLLLGSSLVWGENNDTNETADTNLTTPTVDKKQLEKHLQEQLAREAKYAKTEAFEQGDDYNLSEHQVDPNDLENIQVDEPMYDFNMDDVYD